MNKFKMMKLPEQYGMIYRDLTRVESRLDNLLMYIDFYSNKYGLPAILLSDSSVVLLFRLDGIDYESLSEDRREEMSYYIRTAFDQLDPGLVVSNYLIRRRARIEKLFNPSEAPEIIRFMQSEKQSYWDGVGEESYENQIVCSIRFQGKKNLAGVAAKMNTVNEKNFETFYRSDIDRKIEKIYENYMKLKQSLDRFGFRLLSKKEIHSVLYRLINLEDSPEYREDLSLNSQLAHSRYVFRKDHVCINDQVFCAAVNIKYPPGSTFAMLLKAFYSLDICFVLKQSFEPVKHEKLEKKMNFYQNIALSLQYFDKGCEHYVSDVANFREEVTGKNQVCMYWNWTLYIQADTQDELNDNIFYVKNLLKEMGSCGLSEIENLKFSIFSMFPGHEKLNKRNRDALILSSNAGDLLSAFVLNRGDQVPIEYFIDRSGGIFSWNPFTSRENAWHMAITGPTGTGKSFFGNHMVLSSLVYKPFVYVIDLSKSFRSLFELLQEEIPESTTILTFSPEKMEFCINPFLVDTEEKVSEDQIAFCEGLVSLMCGPEVVMDNNKIEVREALEQFFEEYQSLLRNNGGEPVPPLDLLIPILEQRCKKEEIPNKMKLWALGRKAKLINTGVDNLKLARYCYFDIDTATGQADEELKLIIYCVFSKIMKDISRPENQAVNKFLVLDEAYHYLGIPEFQYYLNRLIRTGRHYKLMVGIITQSISDLVNESEWSKGIVTNLKQAIFFSGQKNIESAFRMMQMDEYHIDLYKSMDPRYREMLYWSSGGVRRVLRMPSDNFSYWLATTDPDEKYYRKLIRDEFCDGDLKKAIEKIIEIVIGSATHREKISRLKAFAEEKLIESENTNSSFQEDESEM